VRKHRTAMRTDRGTAHAALPESREHLWFAGGPVKAASGLLSAAPPSLLHAAP